MMASSTAADAEVCELVIRQVFAWRLPLDILGMLLDLPHGSTAAMIAGRYPTLDPSQRERLALFSATIVRAEIRSGHDPAVMTRLLQMPLPALDDRTLVEAMRDGIEGLRRAHLAIGNAEMPEDRWWRVAPRR